MRLDIVDCERLMPCLGDGNWLVNVGSIQQIMTDEKKIIIQSHDYRKTAFKMASR